MTVGFGHRYPSVEVWSTSRADQPWQIDDEGIDAVSDLLHAAHVAVSDDVPANEEWHYRPMGRGFRCRGGSSSNCASQPWPDSKEARRFTSTPSPRPPSLPSCCRNCRKLGQPDESLQWAWGTSADPQGSACCYARGARRRAQVRVTAVRCPDVGAVTNRVHRDGILPSGQMVPMTRRHAKIERSWPGKVRLY